MLSYSKSHVIGWKWMIRAQSRTGRMTTNRKKSTPLSDDSLNYRCSSLQVNLSCASNTSDSGNESFKHTEVECHNNTSVHKVKCIEYLRSNASTHSNEKRKFLDHTGISYVPLKNASVILERINHDDAMLKKSCTKLKTAILMKTKQIFDEQSELSVKTCTILTPKHDQLSSVAARNVLHVSNGHESTISNDLNNMKSLNERANMTQNINNIPMDKCTNKERNKEGVHNGYRKRHLFVGKNELSNKTVNDNSQNSQLRILQLNNECCSTNDAMTRTDENPCCKNVSLNTLNKLVLSNRTGSCGTDNLSRFRDQSISISNISKDEDTFMATPIACSTMINENDDISDTEHDAQLQIENSLPPVSKMHAKRSITSMEVTDVCEGFILCDKPRSLMEHVKKGTSANCPRKGASRNCTSLVAEQALSRTDSNDEKLLHQVSGKFVETTIIDRDIEQNTNMQYTHASIETGSTSTEKTSLNVNTSVDLISQSDKSRDKRERKRKEKEYPMFEKEQNENAVRKSQESINTVRTSLQMNTSLNISETVQENNHGNKISGSIDTENESRDASVNNTDTSNICKTKNINLSTKSENCFDDKNMKLKEMEKVNNAISTDRYGQVVNKIRTNEQSYIEATPYPMYRSVMLRSQLRQNAESRSFQNNDQLNNDKNELHNFSDMYFKNQEGMRNDTVVSNNLSHKGYSTKVDKKRCKKRLMPLNEHSQVSLSPVEKHYSPPRCLTFRKKFLKRKNNGNKIDLSGIRHDEENEEKTCNENKNQGKKVKKIVSKKIIVKKIVDQEIIKRLEENRENVNKSRIDMQGSNTNSSNDFQSLKGLSTRRCRRKKVFRISIVTTGLSNDDKGIVRSVVKALGSAKIESNVTKRTTHVVTTGVRTINLLHGIIRGCWIVGLEWVLKSLETDAWLNPQEYEMRHFSNAVLENRKDRQLFGSSYVPELFAACGYIHIENNTTPPCNVLKDLVKTAGGCITENPEIAKVVIGKEGLKETWVFDCITSGELQPYNHYVRS